MRTPSIAANALIGAAYGSAGERCMAISVAVAVGDAADRLSTRSRTVIARLKVGAGNVRTASRWDRWSRASTSSACAGTSISACEEGARLVVDGRGLAVAGHETGYFLGPCLFDRCRSRRCASTRRRSSGRCSASCACRTSTPRSQLVNEHEFGNGTSIFTASGEAARSFAQGVQAGMVGINVPIPVPMAFHSFGGWKRSLFGPLHVHGPDGVRFYTRLKTVTSRWPSAARERRAVRHADDEVGVGTVTIWVGTRKGAFALRSDARRRTWKLAGPQFLGHVIHHIVQDPREPKVLLIGGEDRPPRTDGVPLGGSRSHVEGGGQPPAFRKAAEGETPRAVDARLLADARSRERDRHLVRGQLACGTVSFDGRRRHLGRRGGIQRSPRCARSGRRGAGTPGRRAACTR